ncbi:MAG: hypothetical protein C4346_14160 [Chloroflexota bacterium]
MAEMLGFGSKFYREIAGNPPTWQLVAQVSSITPPQPERQVVDIEELDPPGLVKRKLVGVVDPGEVSVTLNYDATNADHAALEQDFWAGVVKNYRIILPNNRGWQFPATVSSYKFQDLTQGDVVQVEVNFALWGRPQPVTP